MIFTFFKQNILELSMNTYIKQTTKSLAKKKKHVTFNVEYNVRDSLKDS